MLCISKRNQHSLSSSSQHFIIHSLQAWCKGMKAKVSLEVFDKSICMLIDWSNEGGVNSSRLVSTLPDSIFYLKKTKIYLQIFCSLMKDLNLQNVKEARVSYTNLFEAQLNFWRSYFNHEKGSQAANAITQYFLFFYFLKRLAPPTPRNHNTTSTKCWRTPQSTSGNPTISSVTLVCKNNCPHPGTL